MKFYVKQKAFSWRDHFTIFDGYQNAAYLVEGEAFSFAKKLHLMDGNGREVALIQQKLWSFLPRYLVSHDGIEVAEIVKKMTFRPSYLIHGPAWTVEGDFMGHEYTIFSEQGVIAGISKQWFTWGDAYEIDIQGLIDPENEAEVAMVLCVVLGIDAIMADAAAAAAH